jgi:hypothetical protein
MKHVYRILVEKHTKNVLARWRRWEVQLKMNLSYIVRVRGE